MLSACDAATATDSSPILPSHRHPFQESSVRTARRRRRAKTASLNAFSSQFIHQHCRTEPHQHYAAGRSPRRRRCCLTSVFSFSAPQHDPLSTIYHNLGVSSDFCVMSYERGPFAGTTCSLELGRRNEINFSSRTHPFGARHKLDEMRME